MDEVLKIFREKCSGMEIPLKSQNMIYTLHLAYDQIVFAQDIEDLEFITRKFRDS